MTRYLLAFALVLGLAGVAAAQEVLPDPIPDGTALCWDHDGVNLAGFELAIDDAAPEDLGALAPGTDDRAPSAYCIAFPALTPGDHTLTVYAYDQFGVAAGAELLVTIAVRVTPADNLRVIQ